MSTMDSEVSDPLKPLEQIFSKDRDFAGGITIEGHHEQLSAINLHEKVPVEVRQIFETAKNISLYSHYAYRLHQPAELMGFVALERAMRIRAEQISAVRITKKRINMTDIIKIAIEDNWFRYEDLVDPRHVATNRARQKKVYEMIRAGHEWFEDPELVEEDILAELKHLDGMEKKLKVAFSIRHSVAHGDFGLSPTSVASLTRTAELINQLF